MIEAIPVAYPDPPDGLSAAAAALDSAAIWSRLESHIAFRYSEREVIWTVEGQGDWQPTLSPVMVTATEVWENSDWSAVTLPPAPLGGFSLPGDGPYRITATVGGGDVPAAVSEAFRRLSEYLATEDLRPGSSRFSVDLGGLNVSVDRAPTWVARALQNSGAADLLRRYRRLV